MDAQADEPRHGKPTRDSCFEGQLPAVFTESGKQFFDQARMSDIP